MSFRMERGFQARPEALWEAWTDAGLFSKWYGPMPGPCRVQELDAREGGTYRITMGGHVDEGVFQALEAPTHLVMAGQQGTMGVRFCAEGDGTRMVLTMPDLPTAHHDGVRGAWEAAFGKLDALL